MTQLNLKEAFRYQNFFDKMMQSACASLVLRDHALTVVKTHKRSQANPDAEDVVEVVETSPFPLNDDVVRFMCWLVQERETLSRAITAAKATLDFDLDAAIEANKFRQQTSNAIKRMLCWSPSVRIDRGQDFKFNAEGNQMPYYYDIEVSSTENYDKSSTKAISRSLIQESDENSTRIDAAIINTPVDYVPRFNVNDTFEDIMEAFCSVAE